MSRMNEDEKKRKDVESFLKEYTWRVDPFYGLIFAPRKRVKGSISLGPSVAKVANKEIADMSNANFQQLVNSFEPKNQERLMRLRKIVTEMKEQGRIDRF